LQQSIPVIDTKEQTTAPQWYIYIVENRLGQLYTGVTTSPQRRIRQHRGEIKGGARALKGKGPIKFRWIASVSGKSDAMRAEYSLKQLKRPQKLALIKGVRPFPFKAEVCTHLFQDD